MLRPVTGPEESRTRTGRASRGDGGVKWGWGASWGHESLCPSCTGSECSVRGARSPGSFGASCIFFTFVLRTYLSFESGAVS